MPALKKISGIAGMPHHGAVEAMARSYDPMWWICHMYWPKAYTHIFHKITFNYFGYNILLIESQMLESYCKVPAKLPIHGHQTFPNEPQP